MTVEFRQPPQKTGRDAAFAGARKVGTADAITAVMVRLRVALHPAPSQSANDMLEALRFLVVGTRSEPGCVSSSAWMEPDSRLHYVEEWKTEAEMRRRVRSEGFTALLAIVEAARDPFVQFDFVSETRGLDYAVEVRNAPVR